MKKIFELRNSSGDSYGVIGKKTNVYDVHVGDFVKGEFKDDGHTFYGIVVKYRDWYAIMGACNEKLEDLFVEKVLPNNLITNDILGSLHCLKMVEVKKCKMTIGEIEEIIGYEIEIIN